MVGDFHAIPEMSQILTDAKISVAQIRIHRRGISPILSLINDVRKFSPDVIHSCLRSGDVAAGIAAFLLRKPVISTVGEKLPTDNDVRNGIGWKGRIHKILLRRVFNAIGATSRYAKHHLIDYSNIGTEKVKIIPNGIDFENFNQTPTTPRTTFTKSNRDSVKVVLGVVGRVAPEKRVDLLPQLIDQLTTKGIDATGCIVGTGISEPQVRALVRSSSVRERITFLGNRTDMANVYRKFDVLVHFGSVEGFGLAIAEAMACGVPVVAPNTGGSAEIINDGNDGILVTSGAIEEYAEKIALLVREESLYRQISINARIKIKQDYSIGRFVDCYESLYTEVTGERGA
jgi:glycosyltransferase involved in cell wall biosynthesis